MNFYSSHGDILRTRPAATSSHGARMGGVLEVPLIEQLKSAVYMWPRRVPKALHHPHRGLEAPDDQAAEAEGGRARGRGDYVGSCSRFPFLSCSAFGSAASVPSVSS